jgi:hypothetical protein
MCRRWLILARARRNRTQSKKARLHSPATGGNRLAGYRPAIRRPDSARTVQFVNLIARRPDQPQSEKLYFVGSHYDTKTFDSIRFVGANDGGPSSGALIELGRVLSQHADLAARIGS